MSLSRITKVTIVHIHADPADKGQARKTVQLHGLIHIHQVSVNKNLPTGHLFQNKASAGLHPSPQHFSLSYESSF